MEKVHHLSHRLMVSVHKNDSVLNETKVTFSGAVNSLRLCSNLNPEIFLQIEEKAQRNTNTEADVVMKEITRKIKDENTKEKGTCF